MLSQLYIVTAVKSFPPSHPHMVTELRVYTHIMLCLHSSLYTATHTHTKQTNTTIHRVITWRCHSTAPSIESQSCITIKPTNFPEPFLCFMTKGKVVTQKAPFSHPVVYFHYVIMQRDTCSFCSFSMRSKIGMIHSSNFT